MGTDVNRADTSYELRHSPGAKVVCLTCSTKSWGAVYVVGRLTC